MDPKSSTFFKEINRYQPFSSRPAHKYHFQKIMTPKYPSRNDMFDSLTNVAPTASFPYVLDNTQQKENEPMFLTGNAHPNSQGATLPFTSAIIPSTYPLAPYATTVNLPPRGQDFGVIPTEQTPSAFPLSSCWFSSDSGAELQRSQPGDFVDAHAVSPYLSHQQGQTNVNGYTNLSYTDQINGSFQPSVIVSQIGATSAPPNLSPTSAKVHSCHSCGSSFTRKGDMDRHARKHGQWSLSCERCGKAFYRKDKLNDHIKTH